MKQPPSSGRPGPAATPGRRISTTAFSIGALGITLLVACVLSLWASSHPDGLEFVAEATGFLPAARDSATAASPLAGYGVTTIAQPWLSVAIAGAIGCAATFGLAWLVSRAARPKPAVSPARVRTDDARDRDGARPDE